MPRAKLICPNPFDLKWSMAHPEWFTEHAAKESETGAKAGTKALFRRIR